MTSKDPFAAPAETQSGEEKTPNAYGGYLTRHEYERARKKSRLVRTITAAVIGAAVLGVLAVFGLISLIRGDFAPDQTEEGAYIRVPTRSDLAERSLTVSQAIAETEKAVVALEIDLASGEKRCGTGFLISEDGYAVCAASLWGDGDEVREIAVTTGEKLSSTADDVGVFPEMGVRLLKLHAEIGYPAVQAGRFSVVGRGQTLYVIGADNRPVYSGTVLAGVTAMVGETVSVPVGGENRPASVMFLAVNANPSLFGAPVMDESGKVIGFCTDAIPAPYDGLCAVVPIHMVYTVVNDYLSNR